MKRTFNFIYAVIFATTVLIPGSCVEEEGRISASPVTAAFTVQATDVKTGVPVSFTDQSEGDVTHWSWIFDGGTPAKSHAQAPSVVYKEPGTYEVTLVVSNSRYSDKLVKTEYITVTATPLPIKTDFSADKVSILSGESVTFTANAEGNPDTWSWQFSSAEGTSLTASGQNPTVTFEVPGTYTATLTASNSAYSDEEVKADYINVVDASSVAADFSADARVVYEGQSVSFTDVSVGTVTARQWTFEGGVPATSTGQNPVVTYASAGTYKVTLEASNETNASVKEQTGFISVIPGEGLVTFLPFDQVAEDRGPFDLPVTNSGSVVFTGADRNNQAGMTAVFDGTGTLHIPASADKQFGASSYSVGVWLKTEVPSMMMVWEEGGGAAGTPQAWFRLNDNASTSMYRLNTNTGGHLQVGLTEGATPLSDGQWHYVVCVRDAEGGKARMYVDGVMKKEISATIINIDNEVGFLIGAQQGATSVSNLYTGQLDDLVIYKRVLSVEEIALLSGL